MFSIARAPMLDALADALEIPVARRSSFLGRFQHLQRLKLIRGVQPGRGKAAEYSAEHVATIAITCQMLQIGLTPERAVRCVIHNEDVIRLSVAEALEDAAALTPSVIWMETGFLSHDEAGDPSDELPYRLSWGDFDLSVRVFRTRFGRMGAQRTSFISVDATLWAIAKALDTSERSDRSKLGPVGSEFIASLRKWSGPAAQEVRYHYRRHGDLKILRDLHAAGSDDGPTFAEAVGLEAEWNIISRGGNVDS